MANHKMADIISDSLGCHGCQYRAHWEYLFWQLVSATDNVRCTEQDKTITRFIASLYLAKRPLLVYVMY